ncbi:MAG: hypothetical protein R6U57_10710 [Anaerolineales bacterium]
MKKLPHKRPSFMITVHVTLYGDIAHYAGGKHTVSKEVQLQEDACIKDLLRHLGVPPDERGYLFINAVLHDAPGLFASRDAVLHEGDHVGIFSTTHMWPYQYRDGIRMSETLEQALKEHGPIRNTYRLEDTDKP